MVGLSIDLATSASTLLGSSFLLRSSRSLLTLVALSIIPANKPLLLSVEGVSSLFERVSALLLVGGILLLMINVASCDESVFSLLESKIS